MKQHDAFAFRDFDTIKKFDFREWYKKAADGLNPELRIQAAAAVNHAELFHRQIVRHLMRLNRLKSLIASKITQADDKTIFRIKKQISRVDELIATYENINHQTIDVRRALDALLDDIAAVERRSVKNIFKERLRTLREEKNFSKVKMAEWLGLRRSTYTAYEAGTNEPTISVLVKLCKCFNKPANWFLGL